MSYLCHAGSRGMTRAGTSHQGPSKLVYTLQRLQSTLSSPSMSSLPSTQKGKPDYLLLQMRKLRFRRSCQEQLHQPHDHSDPCLLDSKTRGREAWLTNLWVLVSYLSKDNCSSCLSPGVTTGTREREMEVLRSLGLESPLDLPCPMGQ
jgi:hypothetical protein